MFIGMLLFWGVLIIGAIWLVRALFNNGPRLSATNNRSPREILDQRYARGEISQAEYEQILNDLSH